MNNFLIIKYVASFILIIIPASIIIRDWKYHDRRTSRYRYLTRAILTVWFLSAATFIIFTVNEISRSLKEEREQAKNTVMKMHILLSVHITEYYGNIEFMINPISNRPKIPVKKNFDFKRLKNLFLPFCPFYKDRLYQRLYRCLFASQDKLLKLIKDSLLNFDLKNYPELSELMLGFVVETEFDNPYNKIDDLFSKTATKHALPLTEKFIEEAKDIKYPVDMQKYRHHVLRPYVRLYNIINSHLEFREKYAQTIRKIFKKNSEKK